MSTNSKRIAGISRLLYTTKVMMNKQVRKLPLKTTLALKDMFKAGKVTKLNGKYYSNSFTPPFPGKSFNQLLQSMNSIRNGHNTPLSLFIAITDNCPYDCWHCSYKKRQQGPPIELKQLINLVKEVQDMGTAMIGITGGEPLTREDLPDFIKAIDQRSSVIMFTTGYGLTEDYAQRLKDSGLLIPTISLDHYKKEIHDKLRGYEGAFEIAVKAVEIFLKKGYYTVLTFAPVKEMVNDEKEIMRYFEFVSKLGVHEVRIASPSLSGKLLGKFEEKFNENEMTTLKALNVKYNNGHVNFPTISSFPLYESKEQFGCGAGFHHCFVDHLGNVCPCDVSPLSFGNITKESFQDIYRKMNKYFYLPGIHCYSNVASSQILDRFDGTLPLSFEKSLGIVEQFPPRPDTELPKFYKKLGLQNVGKE